MLDIVICTISFIFISCQDSVDNIAAKTNTVETDGKKKASEPIIGFCWDLGTIIGIHQNDAKMGIFRTSELRRVTNCTLWTICII